MKDALAGFWGLISYTQINASSSSSSSGEAPPLKLEAEQMERVARATVLDFTSNSPQELGEALWLCSCAPPEQAWWSRTLRERAPTVLDTLWEQN